MYEKYPELGKKISGLTLGAYLEFGCGGGQFLKYLLEQNQTSTSITAVDINAKAIEHAKSELENYNIEFILQETLPLELMDQQFSTITLTNTLHHLQNKPGVLAELKRLIQPDGRIIITEMISDQLTEPEHVYCLFHGLRASVDRLNGVYHDYTYTESEIRNKVMDAGCKIVDHAIVVNSKVVERDTAEIERIELLLDEMIEKEKERPEYTSLTKQVEKIKALLNTHGIKRPRQLYLETVV